MTDTKQIDVEVAYAKPSQQRLRQLQVAHGTTVAEAVRQSGILEDCPEIPWPDVALGIFSRKVSADQVLEEGQRVEIYRPLIADPKARRRARAAE